MTSLSASESHDASVQGFPTGLTMRAATEADRARVTKDWLTSYRDRTRCDIETYYAGQRAVIERLYPHVFVLYRCGSEVHGWVCGEPGVLHYVYVPQELRRHGIARAMVAVAAGKSGVHTHRRMPGLGGFSSWTFNPYKLGMVDS